MEFVLTGPNWFSTKNQNWVLSFSHLNGNFDFPFCSNQNFDLPRYHTFPTSTSNQNFDLHCLALTLHHENSTIQIKILLPTPNSVISRRKQHFPPFEFKLDLLLTPNRVAILWICIFHVCSNWTTRLIFIVKN